MQIARIEADAKESCQEFQETTNIIEEVVLKDNCIFAESRRRSRSGSIAGPMNTNI